MDSTREDAPLPTMVVRLKNTVRLQVKADAAADVKRRFGREFVVTELLREVFGVSACLIFCLQDFSNSGFMDLTFFQLKDCVAFYEAWEKKKDHQRLTGLHLFPAFVQDFLPLTIHLYNPFVEDGDVLTFLARYCETVRGGERLKDRFGIWTGKRRYLVKLRADTASPGGLVHPPGTFFIGSNRGFLHYPGQPVYCRRCGAQGHVKADCTGQRCRFCGSAEHIATACPEPKTCSLCGGGDHLFRVCPSRQKTYASLFKEGQGIQADFEGLLVSVPGGGESQEAGPSGVGAGGGAVKGQVAETRNEEGGGGQELQMSPSQQWSEFDVAEVLCGIYEETELERAESTGGEVESTSAMETELVMMGPDTGQGLRRRKLCEDVTGDREKKCCKVQVQEPVLRRVHRKEAGGEMDTGERGVGESGVEGRGGGGGALERVKSILREDKREGEQRDEGGEGGDWMEVMGKGKGKKCLERKVSM